MPGSQTTFLPSVHGFPFANGWPASLPVVEIPTPFGRVPVGDARFGVCGGMVFAALDLFHYGLPVPADPTPAVWRYLARRLLASWDPPFGGLRYYLWQTRPRLTRATVAGEWPKVRAVLDAGHPAPLGLVQVHAFDPRQVVRNHQVLAYGYEATADAVTLRVYDPNWPGDDRLTLTFGPDPDRERAVVHGLEGPTVRGFFLTEYRKPLGPPAWAAGPG
jgi:hypothetical protein